MNQTLTPEAFHSPWRGLNEELTVGPGQMVTIAGASSCGKSTLATNWAVHAALHCGTPTLLVTRESPAREVMQRIAASQAGVPLDHLRNPQLADSDREKLDGISAMMRSATHLAIDDKNTSVPAIRACLETRAARMVLIDGLQLLEPAKGPWLDREQEVRQILKDLKQAAVDYGILLVLTAQLGHETYGQRPQLTDLEAPSAIAISDAVLLLQRDTSGGAGSSPSRIILAKHGAGRRETSIDLVAQLDYARFAEVPERAVA